MRNHELAARIAADKGQNWLRQASDAELSAATDAELRALKLAQDSRAAIVCLKSIRAYVKRMPML